MRTILIAALLAVSSAAHAEKDPEIERIDRLSQIFSAHVDCAALGGMLDDKTEAQHLNAGYAPGVAFLTAVSQEMKKKRKSEDPRSTFLDNPMFMYGMTFGSHIGSLERDLLTEVKKTNPKLDPYAEHEAKKALAKRKYREKNCGALLGANPGGK